MNEFQLVFRRGEGAKEQTEYRFSDTHREPQIDGRLVVDGETYQIRGADWILKKDDSSTEMTRFICTLVVEPVDG